MRLFIYYKTTEDPWGGINSFIRSFKNYIIEKRPDILLVDSINNNPDIIFMSAASSGVNREIDVKLIRKILKKRDGFFYNLFRKDRHRVKLVHRLDGLRAIYAEKMIPNDNLQIELSALADHIIFQSEFSLQNFQKFGYTKNNYNIINNGVNQTIFNIDNKEFRDIKKVKKIKIISASWSDGIGKGFETIAQFSELENVEVYFVGRWNKNTDKKNVKISPPMNHADLSSLYKKCDIFLHAAKNDPCPNVVLEAMSCGLPIIYNNSGGTKEIALKYGLPLPEKIDANSINETIEQMKNDYEIIKKRIITDYNTFSIEYISEKYIKLFQSILRK